MLLSRRAALLGTGMVALTRPAFAQRDGRWPTRPVRLVLGFAPGGIGDITARLVAAKIGEALGQPIIIDNRPGAAGILAAENVLRSPADGYSLLLLTTSNTTVPALHRNVPYDVVRDFSPVGRLTTFDHAFFTGGNSPYRTLGDVLAAARAKPGQINLGSISVGSGQHLAAELLRSMSRVDMTSVPYRSTPDLMNATTAGDVHIGNEVLAPLMPQVQAGRLRLLAVCSDARFPLLPEVPTVIEAGVPGYVVVSFNGVAAPKGTPDAIIDHFSKEMARAVSLPEVRDRLLELSVRPAPMDPTRFKMFLADETARWSGLIEAAGIPKQ